MPEKPLGVLEIQIIFGDMGVAPRAEALPFTQNDKTGFKPWAPAKPRPGGGMRGYPAEKPGGGSAIQGAGSWL